MNHPLPNMLETTIEKIRSLVNANTVVGEPIVTQDGVTILPVSKISIGLGGGGSDFTTKNMKDANPFGGGVGAGVSATPVAFLIIKDGNVRMLPVATPANTTVDRLVEMIPDAVDKISAFVDSKKKPEEEKEAE